LEVASSPETTLKGGGEIRVSKAFKINKTGNVSNSRGIAIEPRIPNTIQASKMAMITGRIAWAGIGIVLFSF
jgi:hypothetical protein